MRALVTGASGFVGSHLVEALLRGGETVAVLCREGSDLWRLEEALPRVTVIRGDLTEIARAEEEIREFAPDTVFHLAWYGVTGRERDDDAHLDKNFVGSVALLRLAVRLGIRTFVGLGSQAEYGPQDRVLDEDARTEPVTAYGVAKLCTYLFARHLAASSGMRFVWLRLFSSYGPKDGPEWMIPYLVRTLARGECPALTACEQRWDYVYVADAAEAILTVLRHPGPLGQIYNVEGFKARLTDLVCEIGRVRPGARIEVEPMAAAVLFPLIDGSRFRVATGFTARHDLARSVRTMLEDRKEMAP
jgi:nucleoside-diphosphate-sugar epimerase